MAVRENRKESLDERRSRAFLRTTQLGSDVLRRRIGELRVAKGLTQRAVAEAMTRAGVSLTHDKISKIETGDREVKYDELLAFADVLGVPLARLMSPDDGELPIRAGAISLERSDVANWIVWGPWWTEDARGAQTVMRLALQIPTMMQARADEQDPVMRGQHTQTVMGLLAELQRAVGTRPGVMERQARLDAMTTDSQ